MGSQKCHVAYKLTESDPQIRKYHLYFCGETIYCIQKSFLCEIKERVYREMHICISLSIYVEMTMHNSNKEMHACGSWCTFIEDCLLLVTAIQVQYNLVHKEKSEDAPELIPQRCSTAALHHFSAG